MLSGTMFLLISSPIYGEISLRISTLITLLHARFICAHLYSPANPHPKPQRCWVYRFQTSDIRK